MRSILALRDDGHAPCTHVTELIHAHLDDIDRRLAELVTTREALRALVGRAATTGPATCGADDIWLSRCRTLYGPPLPTGPPRLR
ncbi:MerR family DNA-binding protein [Streptomyces cathayae]|uniref:MerR family DNA-binding protein n=1 Tax=Streptomyces cathayae TaxID=3031124 RepID=A0ABY8K934_9ACTN|nr:MerR family DNA-binding protein [Streptomyces sp. HUAS 5]WGD44775.1 MerR family DNA-binding protein [Streptomyces sp. HUAS 5]